MSFVYKIIATAILDNGGLVLDIAYWSSQDSHDQGNDPDIVNRHHMPNVQPKHTRTVRNAAGHLKVVGRGFVNPATVDWDNPPAFEKESVDAFPGIVDEIAARFWQRYKAGGHSLPKDYRGPKPKTRVDDPRGLKTQKLTEMIGQAKSIEELPSRRTARGRP